MPSVQFKEPLQARSEKTLHAILDAAEQLLMDRSFDRISVSEIFSTAGVSIGSFYARFKNKQALLDLLHARYERERSAFLAEKFAAVRSAENSPISVRAEAICAALISLFRLRRGVLRSFILRHWNDPDALGQDSGRQVDAIHADAAALLLERRDEIGHRDPDFAVRFGLAAILSVCRETIVLRPASLPGALEIDDEGLGRELTALLLAYLTTDRGFGRAA